jgi:small subunit ribosomal protein S13
VEIPNKKRIETSLQYVHGVGQTTARQILLKVGLENKITSEVSEPELAKIREELAGYMIEGELVCC